MAAADFNTLLSAIEQKHFKPVYLLVGEETYFIDRLVEAIEKNALSDDERQFGIQTFYGADTDAQTVANAASSVSMWTERQIVELREAQQLKNMDAIDNYLRNPQPQTLLVITYKGGAPDRRRNWVKQAAAAGEFFESARVKDNALYGLVRTYVEQNGFSIEPKAAQIVADSIGSDLSRLYGELDKLILAIKDATTAVTPELVEQNIGISKDFNYFELQNALISKDVLRANRIIKYFDQNQKNHAIQQLLPMMARFFTTLMVAHYAPDKSEQGLAKHLGMRDWQVRMNIVPAMRMFNAGKTLKILDYIRQTDARSKGVGGSKTSSGDLMKELVYFILH